MAGKLQEWMDPAMMAGTRSFPAAFPVLFSYQICTSKITSAGLRRPIVDQKAYRSAREFKSPFVSEVSRCAISYAGYNMLIFGAATPMGRRVGKAQSLVCGP